MTKLFWADLGTEPIHRHRKTPFFISETIYDCCFPTLIVSVPTFFFSSHVLSNLSSNSVLSLYPIVPLPTYPYCTVLSSNPCSFSLS